MNRLKPELPLSQIHYTLCQKSNYLKQKSTS